MNKIIMRKIRAWGMLILMGMSVFLLSGCGGGSLDSGNPIDPETTEGIPNNSPDTYDTQKVLEGSWLAINSTYEYSVKNFSFRLNSARLTFDSVDIKGTVAQSKISSRQEWFSFYTSSDVNIDLGVQSLGLDFDARTGTMIHQGKDRWRCNIDGDTKILMNILVSSDNVIQVNYQGTAGNLYRNTGADYNLTLIFRKQEYSR